MRRVLALAVVVALIAEGASWLALHVLARRGLRYQTFDALLDAQRAKLEPLLAGNGTWYQHIDPDLGWVTTPGVATRWEAINQGGERAEREYAQGAPSGVVRIAAFGDSFVHGDEVTTEQAWPTVLERLQPGIEVLNFGVGGYGIDQAMLRFSSAGVALRPDVVLVGLIADDVLRGVNVFRPFLAPTTGQVLAKPRYVLDGDGALRLLPNPLRSVDDYRALLADPSRLRAVAAHDLYAPPASDAGPLDALAAVRLVKLLAATLGRAGNVLPESRIAQLGADEEPVRLAVATLAEFVARIRRAGAEPLLVILPDLGDLDLHQAGRPTTYQPLLDRVRAAGLPVIDMMDGFDCRLPGWRPKQLIRRTHYSVLGNRLVASHLRDELDARGLLPRGAPAQTVAW